MTYRHLPSSNSVNRIVIYLPEAAIAHAAISCNPDQKFSQGRSQWRGGRCVRPAIEDSGQHRAENPREATPTILEICDQLELGFGR